MTTSRLTLYNGALAKLGQARLATLTDTGESRRLLDDEYDRAVKFCLESGDWNFATLAIAKEASTDVEPSFGYQFAVEKPDDWLRTTIVSGNGLFYPALGPGEFVDEGEFWSCNFDPLYIRYVSIANDQGLDLSLWTQAFVEAVEFNLAQRIGPRIPSLSEASKEALDKRAKRAMINAKSKDAWNQASGLLAPSRMSRARMGYAYRSRWSTER